MLLKWMRELRMRKVGMEESVCQARGSSTAAAYSKGRTPKKEISFANFEFLLKRRRGKEETSLSGRYDIEPW
jgi:hypothetical protein